MEGILFLVILVLAVGIGVGAYYHSQRKRTRALQEVAGLVGVAFTTEGKETFIENLKKFPLFRIDWATKTVNVLQGNEGDTEISIFDYRYLGRVSGKFAAVQSIGTSLMGSFGSGRLKEVSDVVYEQTVLLLKDERLALPAFALRPEGLEDKLDEKVFGHQDVDFESHPLFSKKYRLQGADEDGVRDLFDENLLSYFEDKEGLWVEGNGKEIIVYKHGKLVPQDQLEPFMKRGLAILKRLIHEPTE
jgi:hypothetical protein